MLVAAVPIILGFVALGAGLLPLGIAGIVVGFLLMVLVALASSALNAILLGALYLYAAEGTVPQQFSRDTFEQAFVSRQD